MARPHFFALAALVLISALFWITHDPQDAAAFMGMSPFGGKVTKVTRCTCGPSSLLDIDDVRGKQMSLLYTPGASKLYMLYNVNGTGQKVLGLYTSGGQCMVIRGTSCSTEGNPKGTIQIIGTSR